MAYEDISRSLTGLDPVTFQAKAEKHKLLVFTENQCVYCSYVVKNVKKYTDAGLTMSFVTMVPSSIKDSVIEDMGRVWCASSEYPHVKGRQYQFPETHDEGTLRPG